MTRTRRDRSSPIAGALAVGALTVVAGCSAATVTTEDGAEEGADAATGQAETGQAQATTAPQEQQPVSALADPQDPRLPEPLIDPADLQAGGPPPDGIPAIDEPVFEPAGDVDWLQESEPVLALTVGEESRAYPLRIMTWHEIVNDMVGGVPVAVTYCPLCNSGVAFERDIDDQVLTFGTSGMLYADNLVMYDRQTESLWPQLTGEAAIGALAGEQLTAIPMGVVAWSDFRAAHPDAPVLTRDTGHERPYGTNPYVGYDDPEGRLLFGLPDEVDSRLPLKERVVGLEHGQHSVAVRRSDLADTSPLEVRLGDRTVVLWHIPGQVSALDASTVPGGEEIGTVAAYEPEVDGRRLTFGAADGGFRDTQTGSTWDVLGRATAGPLAGEQLAPAEHLDTFWFAWVSFHPETELLEPKP